MDSSSADIDISAAQMSAELMMEDLVTSKHYFAGGSCCYMFCMNSDQVISDIDNAIQIPYC